MNNEEFIGKVKDAFDIFKNETMDGGLGSGRPKGSGVSGQLASQKAKTSIKKSTPSYKKYRNLKSFR